LLARVSLARGQWARIISNYLRIRHYVFHTKIYANYHLYLERCVLIRVINPNTGFMCDHLDNVQILASTRYFEQVFFLGVTFKCYQKFVSTAHFRRKYFFSVGYLALVVSLSTNCKQIFFSNSFFKDSENEKSIIASTTDQIIFKSARIFTGLRFTPKICLDGLQLF